MHRWQGLRAEPPAREHASWLAGAEEVIGVALGVMAVSTDLWRSLGGLNESMRAVRLAQVYPPLAAVPVPS